VLPIFCFHIVLNTFRWAKYWQGSLQSRVA